MKNTIKLDNPVQINGKSYDELTYDISEITAQAFAEADARKLSASGSRTATRPARPSWTTACTSTSASLPSSPSTLRSTSPTSSASVATTL